MTKIIEQRKLGLAVAKLLGLGFMSYPELERIGEKVAEVKGKEGQKVIVVKN